MKARITAVLGIEDKAITDGPTTTARPITDGGAQPTEQQGGGPSQVDTAEPSAFSEPLAKKRRRLPPFSQKRDPL